MSAKETTVEDRFASRLLSSPLFAVIERDLKIEGGCTRSGIASSSWGFLTACLHRVESGTPIVVVVPGLKQQEAFYQDLQTWLTWLAAPEGSGKREPDDSVAIINPGYFPAWETLPHEAKLSHADVISERLETLMSFLDPEAMDASRVPITVTNITALLQKTFPPERFRDRLKKLTVGDSIDPLDLVEWLESQAYEPEAKVTQKGTLALRGGIVDVFPLASPWPVRIEFFGNEIESIRSFDPQTQMSLEKTDSTLLSPAGEFGILLKDLEEVESSAADSVVSSLMSYVPDSAILIACDPDGLEEMASEYLAQIPEDDPFSQSWEDVQRNAAEKGLRIIEWSGARDETLEAPVDLDSGQLIDPKPASGELAFPMFDDLEVFRPLDVRAPDVQVAEQQREQFFGQLHRWMRQGYRIDVFCNNTGERDRFNEVWSEQRWADEPVEGTLNLEIGMLGRGFMVEPYRWVVVTDAEIFGRYKVQRPRRLKSKHAAAV